MIGAEEWILDQSIPSYNAPKVDICSRAPADKVMPRNLLIAKMC